MEGVEHAAETAIGGCGTLAYLVGVAADHVIKQPCQARGGLWGAAEWRLGEASEAPELTSDSPSMGCVWYVLRGCSGTEKNTLIEVVLWECSLVFLVRGTGGRHNPLR